MAAIAHRRRLSVYPIAWFFVKPFLFEFYILWGAHGFMVKLYDCQLMRMMFYDGFNLCLECYLGINEFYERMLDFNWL